MHLQQHSINKTVSYDESCLSVNTLTCIYYTAKHSNAPPLPDALPGPSGARPQAAGMPHPHTDGNILKFNVMPSLEQYYAACYYFEIAGSHDAN